MFLVALGFLVSLRHMMLAEISLRTPHVHQTPGLAGIYFGKVFKFIDFGVVFIGGLGSLLVYIIAQGEVLSAIFGGSTFIWSLAFFAIGSFLIYFGLSVVKRSELVMTAVMFLITLLIGVMSWDKIDVSNFFVAGEGDWTLTFGVLLFAYTGAVAIPEMRRELEGKEKEFPRALIFGSLAIFIVYMLFTFLVVGVTGQGTTEVGTIGLGERIGPRMILIGNLLAFFTMGTSFLTGGLGLRDMFRFDFHYPNLVAWLIVVLAPLIVFLLGARDFISIVGFLGGVLGSLQTIVIVLTYWQARRTGWRTPEFSLGPMKVAGALIILIFALGLLFSLGAV